MRISPASSARPLGGGTQPSRPSGGRGGGVSELVKTASSMKCTPQIGDIRRASDMFDLTIPPLLRYLATLNHPDLDGEGRPIPGKSPNHGLQRNY